jgi:hypothetical protein
MAEVGDGEVSRRVFQVAYHGEDADYHSMDVDVLAPALTAYGKLIRESNFQINGDKAKVKVFVASDFEHKCFQITFELVQTIIHHIKDLLHDDHVQTAIELLKTIGVVRSTGLNLFDFLKKKDGRKIESVTPDAKRVGDVIVKFEGDGNTVHITQNVFQLAENKKVLEAVEGAMTPVEQHEANRLEFREADQRTADYDQEAIRSIIKSCAAGPDVNVVKLDKPKSETVTATLYVYSPVFDEKAPNWRFLYRKKPIYADISETSIAQDAIRRGGSFINDRYRVRMEVTASETSDGAAHYKIIKVLDFTPAEQQSALPLRKPRKKSVKTK